MNTVIYPLTMFYDATCPFCKAEMMLLCKKDTQLRFRFIDCSMDGFDPAQYQLSELTQADLMAAMHMRSADGQIFTGMAAFREAYAVVGLSKVYAWTAWPVFKPMMDGFYRWFAKNRYRFSKWTFLNVFSRNLNRQIEAAALKAANNSTLCHSGACELRHPQESE